MHASFHTPLFGELWTANRSLCHGKLYFLVKHTKLNSYHCATKCHHASHLLQSGKRERDGIEAMKHMAQESAKIAMSQRFQKICRVRVLSLIHI